MCVWNSFSLVSLKEYTNRWKTNNAFSHKGQTILFCDYPFFSYTFQINIHLFSLVANLSSFNFLSGCNRSFAVTTVYCTFGALYTKRAYLLKVYTTVTVVVFFYLLFETYTWIYCVIQFSKFFTAIVLDSFFEMVTTQEEC